LEPVKNANPVSSCRRAAAAALAVCALAGCGSGKPADQPLKTVWDHFSVSVGGHPANLQVAILEPEQSRGLMQRPDLGRDEGMIFVFPEARRQGFWMRNTPEPLDIAYLDRDGVILEIYPLLPLDERTVASRSDRIQYVVEMPSGWFEAHEVRPGARIDKAAVSEAVKERGFDPARFGFGPGAGP
jgi:uncharacterized membrane protein (UPF0127 family)